jgi:hypothetical protein
MSVVQIPDLIGFSATLVVASVLGVFLGRSASEAILLGVVLGVSVVVGKKFVVDETKL